MPVLQACQRYVKSFPLSLVIATKIFDLRARVRSEGGLVKFLIRKR